MLEVNMSPRPFPITTSRRLAPGRLRLLTQTFIVISACVVTTQAQRPGASNPARDMVRAISTKEMDQLLFLKPIKAPKDDPALRMVLKQISEDFKGLQDLNNKMMAKAWSRPDLDYGYISDMVSQIRGKASRLKSNLALPTSDDNDNKAKPTDDNFSNAEKFRAALLQLDRHIMSFATNPLFQKPEVIEVNLAHQASRDLAAVVELSAKLKRTAAKLGKPTKTSP
jgi:hypothetical protein